MSNVMPGQTVRVINIISGRSRAHRLLEIGIFPGAELKLVSRHPFRGPLIVRVGSATLALGRSVAGCIEVEAV